ncbi:MAG: hypothetical protein JWM44_2009 [Bacilli bacterium]|nr:hypothetical protein [Bacilli bacterium]
MYTIGDILLIIIYICIVVWISRFINKFVGLSSIRVMLLGIALLAFSSSVIEQKEKTDLNEVLSVIGLGITLSGLIKKELEIKKQT